MEGIGETNRPSGLGDRVAVTKDQIDSMLGFQPCEQLQRTFVGIALEEAGKIGWIDVAPVCNFSHGVEIKVAIMNQ